MVSLVVVKGSRSRIMITSSEHSEKFGDITLFETVKLIGPATFSNQSCAYQL